MESSSRSIPPSVNTLSPKKQACPPPPPPKQPTIPPPPPPKQAVQPPPLPRSSSSANSPSVAGIPPPSSPPQLLSVRRGRDYFSPPSPSTTPISGSNYPIMYPPPLSREAMPRAVDIPSMEQPKSPSSTLTMSPKPVPTPLLSAVQQASIASKSLYLHQPLLQTPSGCPTVSTSPPLLEVDPQSDLSLSSSMQQHSSPHHSPPLAPNAHYRSKPRPVSTVTTVNPSADCFSNRQQPPPKPHQQQPDAIPQHPMHLRTSSGSATLSVVTPSTVRDSFADHPLTFGRDSENSLHLSSHESSGGRESLHLSARLSGGRDSLRLSGRESGGRESLRSSRRSVSPGSPSSRRSHSRRQVRHKSPAPLQMANAAHHPALMMDSQRNRQQNGLRTSTGSSNSTTSLSSSASLHEATSSASFYAAVTSTSGIGGPSSKNVRRPLSPPGELNSRQSTQNQQDSDPLAKPKPPVLEYYPNALIASTSTSAAISSPINHSSPTANHQPESAKSRLRVLISNSDSDLNDDDDNDSHETDFPPSHHLHPHHRSSPCLSPKHHNTSSLHNSTHHHADGQDDDDDDGDDGDDSSEDILVSRSPTIRSLQMVSDIALGARLSSVAGRTTPPQASLLLPSDTTASSTSFFFRDPLRISPDQQIISPSHETTLRPFPTGSVFSPSNRLSPDILQVHQPRLHSTQGDTDCSSQFSTKISNDELIASSVTSSLNETIPTTEGGGRVLSSSSSFACHAHPKLPASPFPKSSRHHYSPSHDPKTGKAASSPHLDEVSSLPPIHLFTSEPSSRGRAPSLSSLSLNSTNSGGRVTVQAACSPRALHIDPVALTTMRNTPLGSNPGPFCFHSNTLPDLQYLPPQNVCPPDESPIFCPPQQQSLPPFVVAPSHLSSRQLTVSTPFNASQRQSPSSRTFFSHSPSNNNNNTTEQQHSSLPMASATPSSFTSCSTPILPIAEPFRDKSTPLLPILQRDCFGQRLQTARSIRFATSRVSNNNAKQPTLLRGTSPPLFTQGHETRSASKPSPSVSRMDDPTQQSQQQFQHQLGDRDRDQPSPIRAVQFHLVPNGAHGDDDDGNDYYSRSIEYPDSGTISTPIHNPIVYFNPNTLANKQSDHYITPAMYEYIPARHEQELILVNPNPRPRRRSRAGQLFSGIRKLFVSNPSSGSPSPKAAAVSGTMGHFGPATTFDAPIDLPAPSLEDSMSFDDCSDEEYDNCDDDTVSNTAFNSINFYNAQGLADIIAYWAVEYRY